MRQIHRLDARHGTGRPAWRGIRRLHSWAGAGGRFHTRRHRKGQPFSFPGVSLAALKYLHLERHTLMHGHEPLDTDNTAPEFVEEKWLLRHANGVMRETP